MEMKKVPNPKKVELRKDVDAKLSSMTEEDRKRQSRIILEKIRKHPKYKEGKRISMFLNLPSEVDTAPLLLDMLQSGKIPFVPQYFKGTMRMLRVEPGDLEAMPVTSWGIKQHAKDAVREDALENGGLDLVIAPGAAFTRTGWRLGHGGGYYDRYLKGLLDRHNVDTSRFRKPYIIAIGFNQQIYDKVPIDPQDVQVDELITAE